MATGVTIGLFGQRLSLTEQLKAATFRAHARVHDVPLFEALYACRLPLESYVGQLRALAVVHGALEQALATATDPAVVAVWRDDLRKLRWLQQDLRFFEPRAVADIREAVAAALHAAERIRLQAGQQPGALLGYLYVLEGSMNGAAVLRDQYARAFLLEGAQGLRYLDAYGEQGGAHWSAFKQRMDALAPDDVTRDAMLEAAQECFALVETILRALYPFAPESLTLLATSLNPEAGTHPVPVERRELDAVLRGARRCWQRFPYLAKRYGERGWRFTHSDAAWLATLTGLDEGRVIEQVRWLARVLGARGMPSAVLQDQLEVLADELDGAVPENAAGHAKLRAAAQALCGARSAHLGEAQLETLEREFDAGVDAAWRRRFPRTGTLIGAAVADERAGIDGAVDSLVGWLTATEHFPPEWAAAVHDALARARELAGAADPGSDR